MRATRPIQKLTAEQEQHFWSNVDRSGGTDACWDWQGRRFPNGYGSVAYSGGSYQTHRVAYARVLATGMGFEGIRK